MLWESTLKSKLPWDSGPWKLSKVYLLSKNVCVRPQTCGIRCLGTLVSCKSLIGMCTVGRPSRWKSLDQRGWDICPPLLHRSHLTTDVKPRLPLALLLLLPRACSRCPSWGKAAGTPHTPEDLPGHVLCCGGAIQCEMSGQGSSPYPITPCHRTCGTEKTDPGPS